MKTSLEVKEKLAIKQEILELRKARTARRNERALRKVYREESGHNVHNKAWIHGQVYIENTRGRTEIIAGAPMEAAFRVVDVEATRVMVESVLTGQEMRLPLYYDARPAITSADKKIVTRIESMKRAFA